jgi:hypothetical protein
MSEKQRTTVIRQTKTLDPLTSRETKCLAASRRKSKP